MGKNVLLNKQIITQKLEIGKLVHVIDLLRAKNSNWNSIIDSLAQVIESKKGRNYKACQLSFD